MALSLIKNQKKEMKKADDEKQKQARHYSKALDDWDKQCNEITE